MTAGEHIGTTPPRRGGGQAPDRSDSPLRGALVGTEPRHLTAYYQIGDTPIEAQYRLDAAGEVASVLFERRGAPTTAGSGTGNGSVASSLSIAPRPV